MNDQNQNTDNQNTTPQVTEGEQQTPENVAEAQNTDSSKVVASQNDGNEPELQHAEPSVAQEIPIAEQEETPAPAAEATPTSTESELGKWYVVHTYAGHENKVATGLKQRIESEHLENKILDILVPTQDKIEIRGGKKETVKEKIFPGYILVKMVLDDASWLAVRTTQGVTSFVGIGNKPTPISEQEVKSIVQYMNQGAPATFKDVFMVDDTVKIIDGPFTEFIGKVDSVDKEKGKLRVLVSIFGRETPVELDFLQVTKL